MTSEIESYSLENELFPNNLVSCIGGRDENQDSCGITQTEMESEFTCDIHERKRDICSRL